MRTRNGEKFKLESVEELLGIQNEESAMDIEIEKICPFRKHPFKVIDDEKMQELVESIKTNGVLTPVLVRPLGMDTYEMISGHRRMHAAKLAGLEKIPTIIRELTDDEAVICMVDANVQREELLPSEKAFALQIKLLGIKQKIQKFTNQTSRIPKNKPLEVYFSNPNNNKYNNTYKNNTESNLIPSMAQESEDDTIRCDEMEQYYILAETVKQNIDYDVLLQSYPNEGQLVQGIYELIVETVAYIGKKLVVASNELPAELVKNRLMKLNFMHIQYVISSMKKNTTEIKNIKKYLLAALYNAPATMQGYYQAEVNHAMPQYAKRN